VRNTKGRSPGDARLWSPEAQTKSPSKRTHAHEPSAISGFERRRNGVLPAQKREGAQGKAGRR
jgi:hypothetical protein